METIFKVHDVWEYVTDGFSEPKDEAPKKALSNVEREE